MKTRNDGIELHYEVRGSGAPVLLVHGFPLSGEMWSETVERLEGEFRLIVPDLRGHGRSGASAEASMAVYADDLAAVLDAAGERGPVTVVGLSMGGYVAFEFLRRHPGRVRALALVDTRVGADSPAGAQGRREMAERVLREGSTVAADAMVGKLFASGAPGELRAHWHRLMAATPPAGVAAAQRAMAERPDSAGTLAGYRGPALVVVGEEDAITPPDEARRMHELLPGSRLEIVSGAGHMTPVEQPERFAGVLRDFLRALP